MTSPKTVKAKFFVTEIKYLSNGHPEESQAAQVKLAPVFGNLAGNGDNDENAMWSKYTPQGEISMTINNPDAVEVFEIGKPYYVEFTPAN